MKPPFRIAAFVLFGGLLSAIAYADLNVPESVTNVGQNSEFSAGKKMSDYPKPTNNYVNDFAGVIKTPDAEEIKKLFQQLRQQTGIEAVVVTINSIQDYDTYDSSIESFATRLFNKWGVGKKEKNNGILILVAVKDRKCRIELGSGYGLLYNDVMKRIIDEEMIPSFKAGDHSAGIYKGSVAVLNSVTKKVSMLRYYVQAIIVFLGIILGIAVAINCFKNGKTGWGWIVVMVVFGLVFWLLRIIAAILQKLPSDKDSSGGSGGVSFGGGKSSGGGASGSW